MKCLDEDKLFAYLDDFLDAQEKQQIEKHIRSCPYCAQQVEVMQKEQAFLQETLLTPTLPDHFADLIVADLQPYKQKSKRKWQWGLGAVASLLLAAGITMSVNQSFAQLIGGIFKSDMVDEGLQFAADQDIAERLDITVKDQGITLYIEDLIVDTSRIVLSYQIMNDKGKVLDPYIEDHDSVNSITLHDETGEEINLSMQGWGNTNNYGVFTFSIADVEGFKKGSIKLNIQEIAGKKGDWSVDIPVDLTDAYELQTVVHINKSTQLEGVEIYLDEVRYATSSKEILYQLNYADDERQALLEEVERKKEQFNEEIVNQSMNYYPYIGYRIENEHGDIRGYSEIYAEEDRGHPVSLNMIGSSGRFEEGELAELKKIAKIDSFIPEHEEENLYFVLDTIYKKKVSDFSVTFHPDELPYTFDYNGYELTIDAVEKETDYSLQKSWLPVKREKKTIIHMTGVAEQRANSLNDWAIEDAEGNLHAAYNSGSTIHDETDKQGRFKREVQLISYSLDDLSQEITLHLIAETEAIELEQPWRVPLFE